MLQYKYLRTPKGEDWRYLSYNSEEDAENANLNDLRNVVLGRMMTATSSATFVCIKICTKGWHCFGWNSANIHQLFNLVKVFPTCLSQEHWDTCLEAGPTKRAAAAFNEPKPLLKVLAQEGDSLANLKCLGF